MRTIIKSAVIASVVIRSRDIGQIPILDDTHLDENPRTPDAFASDDVFETFVRSEPCKFGLSAAESWGERIVV